MELKIDILDAKVVNFSNQAKNELKSQIADISDKLTDETLRIETSERLSGNVQEVTSSMVKKASELFLRRYDYVKQKPRRLLCEIVSLVSTLLYSFFFTLAFSNLTNNVWALYLAIPFFAVGLVTSVLSIINKL